MRNEKNVYFIYQSLGSVFDALLFMQTKSFDFVLKMTQTMFKFDQEFFDDAATE